MIPASVYELPSMGSVLEARGDDPTGPWACAGCIRTDLAADQIVCTDALPGDLPRFLCHTCASGPHRMALALQEAQAVAFAFAAGEFDWSDVRGERALRLARCDWTQMPDVDLTPAQVAEWRAYRQHLRDITDTATDPESVVWPDAPS